MKKYIFLICLIFCLLLSLAFKKLSLNNFPLFGRLIILDPGHGGLDPGSIYKTEYEKDYNLAFALSLKQELENNGATVILTREGDYDLSTPTALRRKRSDFNNRIKLINESKADLYLSLHMNYLEDSTYYGSQTFYTKKNKNNVKLADILQKEFNIFFKFDKPIKVISDDKYMFKKIDIPGVLIEYGFISNHKDRVNLKSMDYKLELSNVIIQGIINYFNS